jgi:hypothetical protein
MRTSVPYLSLRQQLLLSSDITVSLSSYRLNLIWYGTCRSPVGISVGFPNLHLYIYTISPLPTQTLRGHFSFCPSSSLTPVFAAPALASPWLIIVA